MLPAELIKKLKADDTYKNWVDVLGAGDKEYVTGTWYNMVMVLAEEAEGLMCPITHEMWELGMQAFDWDYLYELVLGDTE